MCALLSSYLAEGNIKAKLLSHWVKVVEAGDGFKATRGQKLRDQRDGRRAAAGGGRDDQAIRALKPRPSGGVSDSGYGEGYAEARKSSIW